MTSVKENILKLRISPSDKEFYEKINNHKSLYFRILDKAKDVILPYSNNVLFDDNLNFYKKDKEGNITKIENKNFEVLAFNKTIDDNSASEKFINNVFTRDNFICQGCEYDGSGENRNGLVCHVIEIKEDDITKSPCITLCKACHVTQHIDEAVEKEWVVLVNSIFTQAQFIKIVNSNSSMHINFDNTRDVTKPAMEYVEKIRNGTLEKESALKVRFTRKYEF